jgi:preprotein translocase subunit YajC
MDLLIGTAWAQDAAGGAAGGPGFASNLIMIGAIFAIFYFILIRPQNKAAQAHQVMVAGLKKGDQVVTKGGIFGRVAEVEDDALSIEVAKGVRIRVEKSKVGRLQGAATDEKAS